MPTFDEYRVLPVADRLSRLRRTPGELDKAISDRDDGELGRRPDARSWSAKEILCHLRDVEELFQVRFHTIVALDEPRILVLGATPDELAPWRIGGAIPLTYFLRILRGVLLKGTGFAAIANDVLTLCAFAVVLITLSAMRFRKSLD